MKLERTSAGGIFR